MECGKNFCVVPFHALEFIGNKPERIRNRAFGYVAVDSRQHARYVTVPGHADRIAVHRDHAAAQREYAVRKSRGDSFCKINKSYFRRAVRVHRTDQTADENAL